MTQISWKRAFLELQSQHWNTFTYFYSRLCCCQNLILAHAEAKRGTTRKSDLAKEPVGAFKLVCNRSPPPSLFCTINPIVCHGGYPPHESAPLFLPPHCFGWLSVDSGASRQSNRSAHKTSFQPGTESWKVKEGARCALMWNKPEGPSFSCQTSFDCSHVKFLARVACFNPRRTIQGCIFQSSQVAMLAKSESHHLFHMFSWAWWWSFSNAGWLSVMYNSW